MGDQAARGQKRKGKTEASATFEYSGSWATRKVERGESRSDRCERHRRSHSSVIRAFAVPYVDLHVIGQVADPNRPTGPLGGLGPLPVLHREQSHATDLAGQPFGMTDRDILNLLDGMSTKRVAVVEAGTGTGKSTFMPFRLMNPPDGAAYRPVAFGPIVVTEPRRVAATGVARFVGEDLCHGCDSRTCARHHGPGFQVGYQVSGERYWDGACELIYVTDGTMINWIRDGQLARISTVIIDEAHERSENIDIILAQLRELLHQYDHLRVIIASATLDRDFFISYFGGPEKVFTLSVPATKSFGYGTPLFVRADINETVLREGIVLAPGLRFSGWGDRAGADAGAGSEDLRQTTRALEKLRCIDEIPIADWPRRMPSAVVDQVVEIAEGTQWGDILAFLPTSDIIQDVVARIRRRLEDKNLEFDVYPLLATTPKAVSEKAIAARQRGDRRKIVVSSNLAETSLTVKGVRYVVDSGLICQEEWDCYLASSSFPTKPHSQSALRQRWGRVGRDMPGWVFPLYTTEQFLTLARNTPPETVQKGLESFYMKLISSGLDPDAMPLPGGHIPADAELDEAGRENIILFERESARARKALALAGAIDADGHLTEFGRDIERFPGEGGHALAIMLGDQLACAHEVVIALAVLGEGRLVGNRNEGGRNDYILAVDEAWPTAWRVRAAQAHRGLALGCRDELDILLRVVERYQAVQDREAWCARWWVNAAAIDAALDAMMDQVASLSAAMKQDARRNILPQLSTRVRAVLSQALGSSRYRHLSNSVYVSAASATAEEAALAPSVLVAAPQDVIALHRFRRGRSRGDGAARPAEISHIVEFLPWAVAGAGSDDLGLELIIKISEHSKEAADQDRRSMIILDALPVGTLADFDLGPDGVIKGYQIVQWPFAGIVTGATVANWRERDKPGSGFDRDWNPLHRKLGERPGEERAREILKSEEFETNDEAAPSEPIPATAPSREPVDLGQMVGRSSAGPVLEPGRCRGFVVGYGALADGVVELRVDQVSAEIADAEPGANRDLLAWQEIEVEPAGIVRDHRRDYVKLDRLDRLGSFYLSDRGSGLDWFDMDFIQQLRPGGPLVARVLPTPKGETTVTLLPSARSQLALAPVETRPWRKERVRVFPGSVLTEPDISGWAMVELDGRDTETGISFRFRIHKNDLQKEGRSAPFAGTRLFVGLQPWREGPRASVEAARGEPGSGERLTSLRAPSSAIAERASTQHGLQVQGSRIRAAAGDIPLAAIAALIEACPDEQWRSEVWSFYEQSLHLAVAGVYSASPTVEIPVRLMPLIGMRKADFEDQYGVTLYLRRDEAIVGIASPDPKAAARACSALEELANADRLSVRIGSQRANWREVERRRGVQHAWTADGIATVVGVDRRTVEDAMRELVKPARAIVTVPQTMMKRFIGTGGENIKRRRAASGCDVDSPNRDNHFDVRGASIANVEAFLSLARAEIPGLAEQIVDRGALSPIPDPPRPSSRGAVKAWRAANPDFFGEAPLEQLERLAGVKSRIQRLRPQRVEAAAVRRNTQQAAKAESKTTSRHPPPPKQVRTMSAKKKDPDKGFLNWISKLFD